MMPPPQSSLKACNVEAFMGSAAVTLDRKTPLNGATPSSHLTTHVTAVSPATRCCNLLGGSSSSASSSALNANGSRLITLNGTNALPSSTMSGYYDPYCGMTGSLGRRAHMQYPAQQQQQMPTHEFVGVETLDILQGVSPGMQK